jgi:hypothetical protein
MGFGPSRRLYLINTIFYDILQTKGASMKYIHELTEKLCGEVYKTKANGSCFHSIIAKDGTMFVYKYWFDYKWNVLPLYACAFNSHLEKATAFEKALNIFDFYVDD